MDAGTPMRLSLLSVVSYLYRLTLSVCYLLSVSTGTKYRFSFASGFSPSG